MPPLLIATHNPHKAAEFRRMLGDRFEMVDMSVLPGVSAPAETGATFEENARIKALHASARYDGLVLADDSGLEVDALGGAPGVYSARYAGPAATDAENRAKLLQALAGNRNRAARFHCALAVARGGKVIAVTEGSVEGEITTDEFGKHGFGYDPIFQPLSHRETFAELSDRKKSALSHRGVAAARLCAFLAGPKYKQNIN